VLLRISARAVTAIIVDAKCNFSSDLHAAESVVATGLNGGDITWGTFCQDVASLRDAILDHVAAEWVLGISDSYDFAVAFCAVLASGNSLFLPGNVQPGALSVLASSGRGYLHDGVAVPGFGTTVMLPLCDHPTSDGQFEVADVDALRISLVTSGSTGHPKVVAKSLANLLTEVMVLEEMWGSAVRGTRVVATVTHRHIYGLLFRVLWPLLAGNPFDRRLLVFPEEVLTEAGPDSVVISSPALLKLVTGSASKACRAIFSSGGLLPYDAAITCRNVLGFLPFEVFGSTETGGIAWRQQSDAHTPWTLFPGVKARIGDDQSLIVQTPYVTPSVPLVTGDAVCAVGDRQFLWWGRMDRIVKIAEKRISMAEVEGVLRQCKWVQDAAVVMLGEPDRPVLGAVVVLSSTGHLALQELGTGRFRLQLRAMLRRWLEPAAIPRRYREVGVLPVNTQGKLVQKELHAFFLK